MVEVKVMPYSEKYALVLDSIKLSETFAPAFVQKHLGAQAVEELRSIWQEGVKPVPEDASDEEKYEVAYSNFIWMGRSNLGFIRSRMGEGGIEELKHEEVEALKKANASPSLLVLKLLRAISPGYAFAMTAKQMAYKMQWITPFSTDELTKSRAVYSIPRCKVLDFPDVDDICVIGCQSVYPAWFAEQFGVEMKFERQGNSCTCTVTPLR